MFETRKQLLKRIAELEEELQLERHKTKKTGFIDAAKLPPCESAACINCEHIVIYKTMNGGIYPLGCGKNVSCKDFKQNQVCLSLQEKQSLLSEMLRQSQL